MVEIVLTIVFSNKDIISLLAHKHCQREGFKEIVQKTASVQKP